MYDEMRFLFNVDPYIKNKFNTETQVVDGKNPAQSIEYTKELDDLDKTFKLQEYVINKDKTQNYIQNDVNKLYNNSNPYLEYIKFCNDPATAKSLKLSSSDFAYLRDIGVLPINRLMILRRYRDGIIVPVDLNELNVEPIATVIGWVKKDTELLSFSFGEKWQSHTQPLHEMIAAIIKNEFGPDITAIAPIPGWGIGFMFGIMNRMGLTDYSENNVPIGDPNLLKESITRPHDEYGLTSQFTFDMNTTYEQKYIAGIDPTVSHLEILNNLTRMGTSNVTVIGKAGSDLIAKLRYANENPTNGGGWGILVSDVFTSFVSALKSTLSTMSNDVMDFLSANPKQDPGFRPQGSDESDRQYNKAKEEYDQEQSRKNYEATSGGTAAFTAATGAMDKLLSSALVSKILASTLARYQWPLRGSISMFTGDASTPWHLTIGNPYNPLLSMNNIYCRTVAVTYGKDMGFNDVPRTMDVKLTLEQGRPLGKQEIYALFGVTYKRHYTKIPKGIYYNGNIDKDKTANEKNIEAQNKLKSEQTAKTTNSVSKP